MRASSTAGAAIGVGGMRSRPLAPVPPIGAQSGGGRLAVFLGRLERMSSEERVRASRYSFDLWELNVWSARYSDEVPRVNGEYEWIAFNAE